MVPKIGQLFANVIVKSKDICIVCTRKLAYQIGTSSFPANKKQAVFSLSMHVVVYINQDSGQ
jgi:hypothetical protein